MADFQREKNVLRQLVKARDAIKRKYRILKFGKDNAEKILSETLKPIVDPLQQLVAQKNNKVALNIKQSNRVVSNRTKVLTVISMIRLYRMSTIHLLKPQVAKSKMTLIYTSRPLSSINLNILTKFMEYEM